MTETSLDPIDTTVESPEPGLPDGVTHLDTSPVRPEPEPRTTEAPRPFPLATPETTAAHVKGRIKVADEVVEKVAALAALEVTGVADMGGDLERALESVRDRIGLGERRGNQGARAQISDRQVAVDVTIVVEYGHVVMEVANEVKTNVARTVSRMLGLRVIEVNVTVDDVRLPGEDAARTRPAADI
ncbi:putative alkaline shock family protein YloU [Thermocatellispora tengchongensis]|uniref:Putative alkaline shock family protein YloU n=1 Tax=Thermocatellispora tengchongensis TaxID=1073253 RepID=A0A840PQ04_9ACTN|nr:Asp23/Gls24 family envelope stress response protein [Thermocatellispora tengchongensis]MBB5139157.1 putative alkaline shock family protein YloU [Thermocatellispora tengchongensis]